MLRFRLLGMPVTVRTSFLIIAAVIGFIGVDRPAYAVAWIVIIFFSILIHELGHALTARAYGSTVAIELNGLGGLTRWNAPEGEVTPGRRALIAAAGSATGLVFGGLVWLVAQQFGPYDPLTGFILNSIVYVNVFWGLLNWAPIRPLDGGHLVESLLAKVAPERGELIARVVFTATAAAALVWAFQTGRTFIAMLAGWLLLSEFTTGRSEETREVPRGLPTLTYNNDDQETTPEHEPDEPGESDRPPS